MKLPRLALAVLLLATSVALNAKLVTKQVAYEHAGVKLEGYLAYDDTKISAANKGPGVLVVPEWWGLTDYTKKRAEQVAELGYVAFAVDMYGAGVTTEDPKKAGELAGPFYGKPLMAERAQAALDQLLATGLVDAARVAAIGYCFGGSTVQALAYSGAPLAGIVSFHGGLIPVPADAATKTKAKILICHGAVDPFVKKEDVDAFQKAMNDGKFDYQFISYSGAVHAFTNPDADRLGAKNNLPIAYNAAADKRSWSAMRLFLPRNLRGEEVSSVTVYTLRQCSTCKDAVKWLEARGVAHEIKAIRETPPTLPELRAMLAAYKGEIRRLFNSSGIEYRALGMAQKLPNLSEAEALKVLAGNGSLVKRPFLVGPGVALVGFDPKTWAAALPGR